MAVMRTALLAALVAVVVGAVLPHAEAAKGKRYSVQGRIHIPPEATKEYIAQTRVVLDGGVVQGLVKEDGSFVINDVPSASYTLEVFNPKYHYMPIRVDVDRQFSNNVRAFQADFLGMDRVVPVPYVAGHGLEVPYIAQHKYFEERKAWSIKDILYNPSLLIVFVMLGLMYLMPSKEQLEEMKKELEEQKQE
ncbi:hypothetical protein PTSG_09299 [Salpingoeca rosetta]|uniref:ER membrane protein complex subunit 7 beta-sandwich domain-containing protein n=1 Tax=Salpingoeca rosetta (strain ATCC 50818 / BSB-021) TaxID=946362 RepID=F2UM83_SALR5|nr:uncharacterized protein PTSG_09299 [Salpingoeca rosetta]EGD78232.1 hypothetical protein PTSG_09299 [Salpingoeca rosetta]|eukprot:XP_004989555.1 hypothetical protein PTSG_09299 [Salpingoeca rosetta]